MRKLLSIILIASMILVGCGNSESSSMMDSSSTTVEKSNYTVSSIQKDFNVQSETAVKSFGTAKAKAFTVNKTDYGNLTFYVFDTADNANIAYDYIKNNNLREYNEKDNYLTGILKNSNDIIVKNFYYKTVNMIIESEDYCSDPGSLEEESEYSIKQNQARHEKIMNKW